MPDLPAIEGGPDDLLPVTGEEGTATEEQAEPTDALSQEEQPAKDTVAIDTDQADSKPPTEEEPEPQPVIDLNQSEATALGATSESQEEQIPDAPSGIHAGLEMPPPAPEPPIELDLDIPPPPPGSLDDVMVALGLAPGEMGDVSDLPPPPAPEPPPSMEAEVPASGHQDDISVGLTGDGEEHADKKVSFAPGTPEPKPTHRKKKSAPGSRKKKKRSTPAETEGHPDDIVAIIDESEIPQPDKPAPIESTKKTDAVVVVEETPAAPVIEPPEIEHLVNVDAETVEKSLPAGDVIEVPIPEPAAAAPVASPAPSSKNTSKKSAKLSSKEKGTKKKCSKSKSTKTAPEQTFAGLGIEFVPEVAIETSTAEEAVSTCDPKAIVDIIPGAPAPAESVLLDDPLKLDTDVGAEPEATQGVTDALDATTEPDLPPQEFTQPDGDVQGQPGFESEPPTEAPICAPAVAENTGEHADPEPPPAVFISGQDATQADATPAAEEPPSTINDDPAKADPGQAIAADELKAPSPNTDPYELLRAQTHEADAAAPLPVELQTACDVDDAAIDHDDYPNPATLSGVSSIDPNEDVVAPVDDAIEKDDTIEFGTDSAKEEDVSSDDTTEEPGPPVSEDTVEEPTGTSSPDSRLAEEVEESSTGGDSHSADTQAPAESGHIGEDHVVLDQPEADADESAVEVAREHESADGDKHADVEEGDAAVEEDASAAVADGAPAKEEPDVTPPPSATDLGAAQEDPEAAKEVALIANEGMAPAIETIEKPEDDRLSAEDEEANTTQEVTDEHPIDTEDVEDAANDNARDMIDPDAPGDATRSGIPEACEHPDAPSSQDDDAEPPADDDEQAEISQCGDHVIALPDGVPPIEAEDVIVESSALPTGEEAASAQAQNDENEEPIPAGTTAGESTLTVEAATKTADETPAMPHDVAFTLDSVLHANISEDAAANGPQEPVEDAAGELLANEAEQPPGDIVAAIPPEKIPIGPADANDKAKNEAVVEKSPEPDIAADLPVEPPSDPTPSDVGMDAEADVRKGPEPEAQTANEEVPTTGDAVESSKEKQGDDSPEAIPKVVPEDIGETPPEPTPVASPEAPPSPSVSKGSTKRRKDNRGHSSKKFSSDTKSSDKRSSRTGTSDPRSRTDRQRTRRLSMTAEEEAERKKRRDARAAEKAEEAARLAAQARRRADEEAERQLRHEARRAAKKAAVKEAEEVARRIGREEAEAEAKMAAEARRRRRERRDSAMERDRPHERDYERERDKPRRSDRPRDTDRRYEDSKPARPGLFKAFTIGAGESGTRAGLLIRTSSDGKVAREGSKRSSVQESKPREAPVLEGRVSHSERKTGSDRGSHRSRRSREAKDEPKRSGEPRAPSKDLPLTAPGDQPVLKRSSTDRPHRRRRESTVTDERERERPHRSRRESERRERRPTLDDKSKEKKSSFMGSLLKAFR